MWNPMSYHSLAQAFWVVGREIFHDNWTGDEINAIEVQGFAERRKSRENAKRRYAHFNEHFRQLGMNPPLNVTPEQWNAYRKEQETAEATAIAANVELNRYWASYDSNEKDHEAFVRRKHVECRLIKGFMDEDLNLLFNHGRHVEWRKWYSYPSFKVSFAHSLIYAPLRECGARRGSASVGIENFASWKERHLIPEVKLSKVEGSAAYVSMRNWFDEWVLEHPVSAGKMTTEIAFKKVYKTKKKGTFNQLWNVATPEDWRQKGRPSK